MKKCLILISLLLPFLLISCNRNVRTFTGDYSYKLSGDVVFTNSDGEVVHSMQTQLGQLNILKNETGGKGSVVVTVNQMSGPVYAFTATVKGDSLILDDHECVMEFNSVSSNSSLTQVKRPYEVHVSGRGILQGDMLILDENWTGVSVENPSNMLIANSITVLAEQND